MPAVRARTVMGRDMALMTVATALTFGATAITAPVFPRFVRFELGQTTTMVGVIAGSGALGALFTRPFLGSIANRRGTRVLVLVGAMLGALGLAGHTLASSIAPLFPLRVLMGIGQACFLVGSTSMAMDLAPAERRGEATSYVLVGAQVGLALGPLLGESVYQHHGYHTVWLVAACAMLLSVAVCSAIRRVDRPVPDSADLSPARRFHPVAIGPGAVFGIGQLGFIGFNTFVPLYAKEIGISKVAPVFFIMSCVIILIRGFGARLPDQLGPAVSGTIALSSMCIGLLVVGTWNDRAGLYAGTIGIAIGSSFLYPSLASAAITGVSDRDRVAAVATFTLFLDLTVGLAPMINGSLASAFDYRAMFLISAGFSMVALLVLHAVVMPSRHRRASALTPNVVPPRNAGA